MPIEILRFGVGHRRADGPAGTKGINSRVIHSDARGVVAELAFARGGLIEPHSNPNTTYFIVIEGGGWVLVGEERVRVAAGEAAVWPAGVVHGAWAEETPMRAFVVEFAGADDADARGVLTATARPVLAAGTPAERGKGELVEPRRGPADHDRSEGEPL
jgi:quercetin dioxygenase-like cupin family protein